MTAVHVLTAIEQTINIRNTAGALADPTTLVVTLRAPDGTQTTYTYLVNAEITRTSVGVFVFHSPALDQVTSQKALWWVAWVATGAGVTVSDEASQEVCGLHVSLA